MSGAREVQGEGRAEFSRALLSRSLHSPSQLVCGGKGTAFLRAPQSPFIWILRITLTNRQQTPTNCR